MPLALFSPPDLFRSVCKLVSMDGCDRDGNASYRDLVVTEKQMHSLSLHTGDFFLHSKASMGSF